MKKLFIAASFFFLVSSIATAQSYTVTDLGTTPRPMR
jgi:hypothetical protein